MAMSFIEQQKQRLLKLRFNLLKNNTIPVENGIDNDEDNEDGTNVYNSLNMLQFTFLYRRLCTLECDRIC